MVCDVEDHSLECRGPGDVENHIFPEFRKKSISELMKMILDHCGDDFSNLYSCPCPLVAEILREKLRKL